MLGVAVSALVVAGCPSSDQKGAPATGTALSGSAAQDGGGALPEIELPPGTGPVASVNGVEVLRGPFNKEYRQTMERYRKARHEVQPALRERLKDNIVRRLVDAEIIKQQTQKLAVEITAQEKEEKWAEHKKRYGTDEAFRAFLERAGTTAEDVQEQFISNLLREKVFAKVSESVTVTPQEVKEYYEQNKARYDEPEQVQASHILIKVQPNGTPEEKGQKKKRAEEALKKVKTKGADFAKIAKEYGEDPTRDRGGDLGYFTRGRMVKPFEDAVWGMKTNQISNIIETQFGFHVIKKIDHKKARQKPFKEVTEQIERSLVARKRNQVIRDALQKWKDEAKIELFVKGDESIIAAGTPPPAAPVAGVPPGSPGPGGAPGQGLQGAFDSKMKPAIRAIQSKGDLNPEGGSIQRLAPPDTRDQPIAPSPH